MHGSPQLPRSWIAICCGAGISAGASAHVANVAALAPTMAAHYGAGLPTIGLLTSIAFLAELIVLVPAGHAIDRFGPRLVAIIGLTVTVGGTLGLLTPVAVGGAFALRFCIGVGLGVSFVAGSDYVRRVSPTSLAQGVYGGAGLAASSLMLAVLPVAGRRFGWQAGYWLPLFVSIISTIAALLAPRAQESEAARETAVSAAPSTQRPVMSAAWCLRHLSIIHCASFAATSILATWAVTLMLDAGHRAAFSGAVSGLMLISGVVGRPAGGWIASRGTAATRIAVTASLIGGIIGVALLAALPRDAGPAIAGAILVGLSGAVPFAPILSNSVDQYPHQPGLAIAVVNAPALLLIVAGVPIMGATFSLPGHGRLGFALVAAALVPAQLSVGAAWRKDPNPVAPVCRYRPWRAVSKISTPRKRARRPRAH